MGLNKGELLELFIPEVYAFAQIMRNSTKGKA